MTHGLQPHHGQRPAAALASAWDALCGLPATHSWFWLVRSAPVEATPAIGLVLLDALPVLLDALGAGAFRHG
ncbi:hypothetical protein OF122_12765 [Pelagibacterium flavum]|uniref:Uncharacterized protein n=1 Tax=Pelagibacterium flavum TaxID=2984530 RepID=A0ABY6IKA1_9HYPH|nr:hypothetical protein [Pelagibacterium sp. YIM 151497]UYQ70931.1 hypothetical protein OF122_12765 [Pelagibacterium sp. YIM 151497]